MQNLRAVFIGNLIQRALVGGTSHGEGLGGDVVLQKLFVDDVCDGGDECLDVLGVVDESVNVACDGLLVTP
jgi:hypothetical protein